MFSLNAKSATFGVQVAMIYWHDTAQEKTVIGIE